MTGADRAADPRHPQRRRACSSRRWSGTRPPAPSWRHDFVEVGPAGTVESWTWVPEPSEQHPLDHPFAFAFIRLDGATTPLLHAVDAGSPDAHERRRCGSRRAGRARASAASTTSPASCPARSPRSTATDTGPPDEPVDDDGLPRLDHLPEPGARRRPTGAVEASQRAPPPRPALPGLRAGLRRRARATARSTRVELGPEHEVDLPADRHDHQLHDRHARCSTRARPRPSRSPGSSCCSTAPT